MLLMHCLVSLSRVSVGTIQSPHLADIDFPAMALAQQGDQELEHLKSETTSLVFQSMPLPTTDVTLVCDTSTGNPRPYVPLAFRRSVFNALHGLSHPGIRATQKLITSHYVWPSINSDVRRWIKTCMKCQRSKVQRHTMAPLIPYATPDKRFDKVHLDIVGPLPPCRGFSYLMTCVDRFTRWPE